MELMGLEDIMKLTGLGRKAVTHLLNMPGCPTLPRVKKAPYYVPKESFIEWMKGGCQ